MSRRPLIVLADDLTGAAEIAAIAHQAGLAAVVLTRLPPRSVDADVLVLDTDTRLLPPARAAGRVRRLTARLRARPHGGFFKKTDSVLRGPVLAELAACARALGLRRTLLVPANPSLGRVMRGGRYTVAGRPLHQTAFARDPHHPARSSLVLELLGTRPRQRVTSRTPRGRLPAGGVIVGDAATAADIARWVRAVDRRTLPAGGADFFRAWLQDQAGSRRASGRPPAPAGAALLLHGTTAAPADDRALLFHGRRAPATTTVAAVLRRRGAAVIAAPAPAKPCPPTAIAAGFAGLARRLHRDGAFRHLLIAGGATAAAVLGQLGWSTLKVVRVWGPGVVSLQPTAAPGCTVTLKPGSYPWPAGIRRSLPRVFS